MIESKNCGRYSGGGGGGGGGDVGTAVGGGPTVGVGVGGLVGAGVGLGPVVGGGISMGGGGGGGGIGVGVWYSVRGSSTIFNEFFPSTGTASTTRYVLVDSGPSFSGIEKPEKEIANKSTMTITAIVIFAPP